MKKFLVFCFVLMVLAGVSMAYNFNANPPSHKTMKCINFATTEAYPFTFEATAVQYELIARNANVVWWDSNSTLETDFVTIKQDMAEWNPQYVAIPKNTIWYFKSSVGGSLEAHYYSY